MSGDQASKIAGDSEALAYYKKAISAHEEIFGDQLNDFDISLDPINQTR